MRLIYVPIADSFFESSIMQEDLPVRFVMLSLIRLALRAGSDGVVDVDLRTFAGAINLPVEDVQRAILRLMEPDEHSGSPDENGRRIVAVDPAKPLRGWRLVNWAKYRQIVHRANDAARKRRDRDGVKDKPDTSESVHVRPDSSTLSENGATNTNTKTKTTTREEKKKNLPTGGKKKPNAPSAPSPSDLLRIWNENRGGMLPARSLADDRVAKAKARLRQEPDLAVWTDAISRAAKNPFTTGTNDRGWKAGFDWLLRPGTLAKILEGSLDGNAYPTKAEVEAFSKALVGLGAEAYRERFIERFGVEPHP